MNVLFIYSLNEICSKETPLNSPRQMHFGISYMSSFLIKNGHRTKLLVLSRILGKKNESIIDEHLRQFEPKLICFTTVASEYSFMRSYKKV